MPEYRDVVKAHRRLEILRALDQDPSGQHNDSVLQGLLDARAHTATRDQIRTELSWLSEQDLIQLEHVGPDAEYYVAQITERGHEVAMGRTKVPGVEKPRPGR